MSNDYYKIGDHLELIEIMQAILSHEEFQGFVKGNVLKYAFRAGKKPLSSKEDDIKKLRDYIDYLEA